MKGWAERGLGNGQSVPARSQPSKLALPVLPKSAASRQN